MHLKHPSHRRLRQIGAPQLDGVCLRPKVAAEGVRALNRCAHFCQRSGAARVTQVARRTHGNLPKGAFPTSQIIGNQSSLNGRRVSEAGAPEKKETKFSGVAAHTTERHPRAARVVRIAERRAFRFPKPVEHSMATQGSWLKRLRCETPFRLTSGRNITGIKSSLPGFSSQSLQVRGCATFGSGDARQNPFSMTKTEPQLVGAFAESMTWARPLCRKLGPPSRGPHCRERIFRNGISF